MKKYSIVFIVFIVFIFLILVFISNGKVPVNYPSSGEGIVAFGDSLILGVGASPSKDLVSLLGVSAGYRIENFGRSGDTTALAKERLHQVFERVPNPKVAIILLGGNDFLHKVPRIETFKNLELIIKGFQARGSVVLLLGVRGGILKDSYSSEFKDLSKKFGTAFVPNVLDDIIGDPRFMYDSIHPNDLGYQKIADRVAPVLRDLLKD